MCQGSPRKGGGSLQSGLMGRYRTSAFLLDSLSVEAALSGAAIV